MGDEASKAPGGKESGQHCDLKTHKDLDAWKKSLDVVEMVYRLAVGFPKSEMYGLTSQLRRAAVSIPSNVAEGAARNSPREFVHFLHVSLGSASELVTQLIIAKRLGYLDKELGGALGQIETVRRLILGLIRYLRSKDERA